jgi:hypothetical protein
MRASFLVSIIIICGLAASCFHVDTADGTIKCLPGSRPCPQGYFCGGNGYCYQDGHTAPGRDMGVKLDDMATVPGDMSKLASAVPDMTCGNLQTDPLNCGACGHDCTMLPNVATATGVKCSSGICNVPASACQQGFAHCSSDPNDGCEANLSQSMHCGSCNACPSGTPLCAGTASTGYMCTISCSGSTPDQCGNTCTNLQSDPSNCKTCSNVCSYAHATAVCNQGTCAQGTCSAGYMHCSANPNSGCETYVMGNDASNCGGCGVTCKVGQICASGSCQENQVTCSSAGVTCQQASCYIGGRFSISSGGGIVVDLSNGPRNLWTRATRTLNAGHASIVEDCETLVLEGISGWRLPEMTEYQELDYMTGGLKGCPTCYPAIDQAAFPDTANYYNNTSYMGSYWSNTANTGSSGPGWYGDDECDGRSQTVETPVGTPMYRCIHNPL